MFDYYLKMLRHLQCFDNDMTLVRQGRAVEKSNKADFSRKRIFSSVRMQPQRL